MVAVIPAAPAAAAATSQPRNSKNPSAAYEDVLNPSRPPLNPSEKDNAGVSRRLRIKQVTSRYLSSYSPSSPSTTSTSSSTSSSSTVTSATTATSGSSSSSSSSHLRRFPSPLPTPRPSTPASALPQSTGPKRSQSVDRARPATPRPDHGRLNNAAATEISSATKALCTTTRSLSVSFQGESFFYQTSKAKVATPNTTRKHTPERRRAAATPVRNGRADSEGSAGGDHPSENSRPGDHHRWPAARIKQSNPLTRSLDYSLDKKDPIFATVRLLQHSMIFDEGRRTSFDGGDLSASSDTDSVSSGSNSGAHESCLPARARVTPRGISVPARFWQETNSRLRRSPEPGSPLTTPLPRAASTAKLVPVKKPLIDCPALSPRTVSSRIPGPIRPSSPSKIISSPARAMSSPSRTRSNGVVAVSVVSGPPGNAPSMINFASEVRRGKKGECRIEEAHVLRLLHNRHLQWRHVNAKSTSSLLVQRHTSEKNLYNAWVTTAEMRDSITIKKIKLHLMTQNMKLASILKGQMAYLEEWSLVDREHSSSLSGAIESLKASTLRLPVVGGAKVDIQDVKDAVGSAVDVMQAMGSSIRSVLSKVEGMSSLFSELAKVAAQEQALLDQSHDLLCTVAALHVKQCSLQGHLLQLRCRGYQVEL
uniref:Protein SNOWY COTYLEDON 3 n=1 Tax=Anthurium amnicola TaxID=1678845 RepID=A0A1D1XJC4_9ARAE